MSLFYARPVPENRGRLLFEYNIYFTLFYEEFDNLVKSDIITDEALKHLFTSAKQILNAGESVYDHNGYALEKFAYSDGDKLYARCTPEQQAFYLKAFEELLGETEKAEKERIAAGKPIRTLSVLPLLQKHLDQLRR